MKGLTSLEPARRRHSFSTSLHIQRPGAARALRLDFTSHAETRRGAGAPSRPHFTSRDQARRRRSASISLLMQRPGAAPALRLDLTSHPRPGAEPALLLGLTSYAEKRSSAGVSPRPRWNRCSAVGTPCSSHLRRSAVAGALFPPVIDLNS
jgi:hypothetical protein